MKAIFIAMQGALIEGSGPRCTLRCGAGAGLALLMDLDYRLIVIDGGDGAGGGGGGGGSKHDGADNGPGSAVGKLVGTLAGHRFYSGAAAIADHRSDASSPAEPPRSPPPTGHAGHRPARLLPPVAAFWPQPGRLPDNGRRRRSSDPEILAGDGAGNVSRRAGPTETPGADADADIIVDDGSDKCDGNRWSGANTWDAGDSKSVGATWSADTLWDDDLAGQSDGNAGMNGKAGKNGIAGRNGNVGKNVTAGKGVAADKDRANIDGRANPDVWANSHDRTAANIWKSAGVGDDGNAWRTGPQPQQAAASSSGGDGGVPVPTPTSQSPSARANQITDRLGDLLFRERLALQAYYCCSHADGAVRTAVHGAPAPWSLPCPCHCLAPQPGLLLQAAFDHGIDLAASWMIGATLDDVEAGNRAGCRTVMIDSGLETSWRLGRSRVPTRIAPDLYTAALLIGEDGNRPAG